MPVMLANEALDNLLEILSTACVDRPTHKNPDPNGRATARSGGAQGEHTVDEQDPSLVLCAKLLGAFSLEPTCGCVSLCYSCPLFPRPAAFKSRQNTYVCPHNPHMLPSLHGRLHEFGFSVDRGRHLHQG